jgi:hypothetical protein
MRKALLHTFVAMVITTLLLIIAVLLPANQGTGLLVGALVLFIFCAPFPTYLAVLFYSFVTKKIFPNKKLYAFLVSVLLPLFLYHLCLVLFVAIIFEGPWSDFINRLIYNYTDEFAAPTVLAVLLMISIPLADMLIEKVKRDLKQQ